MGPKAVRDSIVSQPLKLSRTCLAKVWGGRSLERTPGIALDLAGPVGETWELVDRDDHNSRVVAGPLAGRTLRGLMESERAALLGAARATEDGRFPLLVKFISAVQPLSVQVHPDDATAKKLGAGENGKTEAWYVLAAEPGSQLHLGLQADVDAATFAARAGGPEVVDLLRAWPVRAGQFVFVPAGTLHSIGAGITLVEVQQNSDVTYRVFDWGRPGLDGTPRETHLEQALLATRYGEAIEGPVTPELVSIGGGNRSARLCDCELFALELIEVGTQLELDTGGLAVVYVVVEGRGGLGIPRDDEGFELASGDTWLVPAALGRHRLEARGEPMSVLRVETRP